MFRQRPLTNFRNIESYDEEALPVKVTYFDGSNAYFVNPSSSYGESIGSSQDSSKLQLQLSPGQIQADGTGISQIDQQLLPTSRPLPPPSDGGSETRSPDAKTCLRLPINQRSHVHEKNVQWDKKRAFLILSCMFVVAATLLASGIIVRQKKNRQSSQSVENFVVTTSSPTMSPDNIFDAATSAPSSASPAPVTVSLETTTIAIPTGSTPAPVTPTTSPSVDRPTTLPTLFPNQPTDVALWIQALGGVTDPQTFTQDSPQRAALQWISSQDPLNLEPVSSRSLIDTTERWNDGGSNGIICDGNNVLTDIFIVDNNLRGTIPSEINHLINLERLNLYYNYLSGSIPELGNLAALQYIDLDGNNLSGSVPDSLFNVPSITTLLLLNNPTLTGTIPEITLEFPKLEKMSFYNCSLSGTLPESLGRASDLKFVQFYDNALTGSIPSTLTSLPSLELFSLRGNQLTGTIPPFNNQATLNTISLGDNDLHGSLPAGWSGLSGLTALYLQDNKLTGVIPDELYGLPLLEQVWLYGNNFQGLVPTFVNNPGTLEQLYLNDNDFTGTIDALIAQVPLSLQILGLGGNPSLSGSLPGSVNRLTSLVHLNISYTGLTGTIPDEVSSLELTTLSLEGTGLTGDLSTIVCSGTTLPVPYTTLTADCGGSTPKVACGCCTECCANGEGNSYVCTSNLR